MFEFLKKKNSVYMVMVILLITKVLGFLKLRIIAQLFGVSHELDIFWAAFTIPDMLFMVVVAGSINAAIIPIFTEILHKKGQESLDKFFNNLSLVINCTIMLIATILFVLTPQLTEFIINSEGIQNTLNFAHKIEREDFDLFVNLTRIMMISPVLLSVSTLITGYLQSRKQFFVTSLAPLFYNLAMIVGPIIFVAYMKSGVYGIAWSAVIGSFLHFLIQLPLFKKLYKGKLSCSITTFKEALKDNQILRALKLATPRTISIIGEQINVVVNTLISFSLSVGALSAYKFALSLHTFPINIIGSSVAQVALPDLAEHSEDKKKFGEILNKAVQLSLYLVLPIVSVLLILRFPIVRLAYGTGAFDWRATIITAWCLVLLSLSIIGQTVTQILLRAFYAIKETWLPLFAVAICIVLNVLLAYWFTNFFSHYYDWRPIVKQMFEQLSASNGKGFFEVLLSFVKDITVWCSNRGDSDMAVGGLSLSLSITYFVEMGILSFLLNKKVKIITWKETIQPSLVKFVNAGFMAVGMYFLYRLFDFQLDTTRTVSILILTVCTTLYGGVSYWIGSKVFNIKELEYFEEKLFSLKDKLLKKRSV
ncbi:MAG: murein biosynthesis integral membrane protein MurJ [Candidatus Dojkabacteria bacterium]|jgi:putative peptidoglycan lipid II flippase